MHCSGAGRFSILRTSGCRFSRVRAFAVPERSCLWAGRAADFANSACRAYETAIPENLTDEGCSDMLIFSGMRRAPMLCSGLLQSARREYGRAATSLVLVATSFTLQFARREDGRACDGRAAALGRAPADSAGVRLILRILRAAYPTRLPLKALRHADFSAGAEKRRCPARGSFSPRGAGMDERATGALLLWGERLRFCARAAQWLMILLSAVRMLNMFSLNPIVFTHRAAHCPRIIKNRHSR